MHPHSPADLQDTFDVLIAGEGPRPVGQLARLCESAGMRIARADQGRTALAMIRRAKPRMLICNIAIRDPDGFELCRQIKNTPALADIAVLLVASEPDARHPTQARECGADVFLLLADVRLPILDGLPPRAAERPAPMVARGPGSRSLRVLLVDDDTALLESLRSALEDEGHKVICANGGQTGIDNFRAALTAGMPFDVVITDFAMPYVDGRQVAASLRALSPATPIILLTGWGQQWHDAQEQPLPVDRLLGKPPRMRELRLALADLTGRRATDRRAS